MLNWFRALVGRPAQVANFAPSSDPAVLGEGQPRRDAPPPAWAEAIAEGLTRSSRAQTKLGLRLEAVEGKLEAGFADLRGELRTVSARSGNVAPERWEELFDGLDALDQAVLTADELGAAALAAGLRGVIARLTRLLAQADLNRLSPLGQRADGRRFRVVGTLARADLPVGVVVSVARAAIVRGDEVVREGEVITNLGAS